MRRILLFSLMLACTGDVSGQTARRTQPAGRSGLAITVTTAQGITLGGVQVQVTGAAERNGQTDAGGQINFPGLQAGTYRLRFSGDAVVAFEREVTLRAGQIADLDITLTPAAAPKPAAAEPPPAPGAPPVGPLGTPLAGDIADIVQGEPVGRQPRRESLISCSGNTRTTVIQLNEPLPQRVYDGADAVYYVIGGEGTVRLQGRDVRVPLNGYISVPRGTVHSFERRGNRPLILLAVLGGEACEQAR